MTRFATLLICAIGALAQTAPSGPAPTLRDIRYGEHPKQTIDFYKANSDRPTPLVVYIHGGGWTAGTKNNVAGLQQFLDAGISVASVEYRFIRCSPDPGFQTGAALAIPLASAQKAVHDLRSFRWPTTHGRRSWPGSTSTRPTNTPAPAILPFTWTTQTRKSRSFRGPIRRT